MALDMLQGLGRARCFKPTGVEFARECCRYHHAVVFSAAERLSLLQSVAARHAVSTRSPTLRPSRTRTYYVTFSPNSLQPRSPSTPDTRYNLTKPPNPLNRKARLAGAPPPLQAEQLVGTVFTVNLCFVLFCRHRQNTYFMVMTPQKHQRPSRLSAELVAPGTETAAERPETFRGC